MVGVGTGIKQFLDQGQGIISNDPGKVGGGFHIAAIHGPEQGTKTAGIGYVYIRATVDEHGGKIIVAVEDGQAQSVFAVGGLGVDIGAGIQQQNGGFQNYVAIFTIITSTVLNAAYFLPIVFLAWFGREAADNAPQHGEAPLPIVIALTTTAALTILFFLFNGPAIELESQIFGGAS